MDKAKIPGCRAEIHLCILKDWDALQVDLQAQKMPMRRRQDGFLRIALIAVQCFNTGSPVWAATELWLHGWQLENAMVPCPVTRERERERQRQRENFSRHALHALQYLQPLKSLQICLGVLKPPSYWPERCVVNWFQAFGSRGSTWLSQYWNLFAKKSDYVDVKFLIKREYCNVVVFVSASTK